MIGRRADVVRGAVPLVVGAGALTFSVCLYFPGYLSFDSAYQFWQVRTHHFSNQSPVPMTALWQALHAVWPSPAALLTLHFVAYWTGLVLLAVELWQRSLPRVVFIAAVGFVPPAFVVMGHLWTDASLIAAMTLGFGLTVTGLLQRRVLALALALPVILYAGAVRHNSLLAVIPLAGLWAAAAAGILSARRGAPASMRRGAFVGGVAALVVVASFGFGRGLDRIFASERVSTWALVALWDLAAISVKVDTMLVPVFARGPGLTVDSLRRSYTPLSNVPLFSADEYLRQGLGGESRYSDEELGAIRRAWLAAIASHPRGYFEHRRDVTAALFGRYGSIPEGFFFAPVVVPYRDNPPAEPALWTLRDRLAGWLRRTRGWPIFAPALYLAIAAGAAAWAWPRRDSQAGKIALSLAASGLLLVLPLAIAAPSAELRYSGWLFVSSVIAAACAAGGARGRRR